ncbi:MFS transporter [Corynebacterium sp. P5875]|uniref:MFS transporter n=1 Tax=Corynebacterium antarcticum TaxID=2800405 RepID=A0A9Q4GL13_9CORY|nr:MFS transporter [Corynebacterium antarcticum]MCX7537293.1 MFS transporter [Corynebacterium antarcticum]
MQRGSANTPGDRPDGGGIFSPTYLATTVGLLMAITACAFDNTAVTAVMPRITEVLGDTRSYSLAFAIPFAVSIVAMVAAGIATDVAGVRLSLLSGTGILAVGLALSVVAPDMTVFLISRGIQGFGIGAVIVAIYALIAQVYPARLRAPVFAAFSGAWVIPSLVGPALAGVLTETFSWHSVFLFTLVLLLVAAGLLWSSVRRLPVTRGTLSPRSTRMLLAALALSAAAGILNYSSQLALGAAFLGFVLVLPVIAVSIRPLVPAGTLRGRPGVPRLVSSRVLTDMVLAAEIYIPLLLAEVYGLGPTLTGLGLTASGVTWFIGSHIQARHAAHLSTPVVCRLAAAGMAPGLIIVALTAVSGIHWAFAVAGWGLSAFGIGFVYPRISSDALELSPPERTGFIGSALQVAGITGMTVAVAVGALTLALTAGLDVHWRFLTTYLVLAAGVLPFIWLWRPGVEEPSPESLRVR